MDYDKVKSADDSRVPVISGIARDENTGLPPEGTCYLFDVPDYCQVEDGNGNRFRKMGYGFVQGSVIVRDRYRTMYQAYGDTIVRRTNA